MKNVLIVYKFLPEYRVDFYQQLRKKLAEHDIKLHLFYGKFDEVDALRKNEVDIEWAHYVPNRRFYIRGIPLLWQPVIKFIKNKDLIIAQPENGLLLNYYLMIARHFAAYKFAFWGHVTNMQADANSRSNKFKLLFVNRCDWWFAYTVSAKKALINNNYPANKITAVQNAIDTSALKKQYKDITDDEVAEIRRKLDIDGNNIGIFCGGMYPDKGFDFILDVCDRVKKDVQDFQMLFVGSGIEQKKIIQAAKTRSWIHFIGPKFGKDRVIYFRIATLQIMPRLVGLCILDSFAMETPIITTEHPYHGPKIDYLENGINGIITRDDINIYCDSIINTFRNFRYKALIQAGKLSAEKYTVEQMSENFKNGILACLNIAPK